MEKIYGFKQKDVEELIKCLETKKDAPLISVFERFAAENGKSKGTVRNMYYALVRKSREDAEFTAEFLGGKPLSVQKISEFGEDEERSLVKKILLGKKDGRSARAVIGELAQGDAKVALRYQNKYRNVLKNKQSLVAELTAEIRRETGSVFDPFGLKKSERLVSDVQIKRLQDEINGLLARVTDKLKRENMYLKERLNQAEIENMRMKNMLYGGENKKKATEYFKNNIDKNILS